MLKEYYFITRNVVATAGKQSKHGREPATSGS